MKYKSLKDFYPFYLKEHSNQTCKVLHFIGTSLVITTIIYAVSTQQFKLLFLLPVFGYSFAWVGHFVFEKNRPASFKQPIYSLISDFMMFWHLLTGRLGFSDNAPLKN